MYNWEGMNNPSKGDDLKNFRVNNLTIPFNVWYAKNKYIYPANDANHNLNREKKKLIF